MRALLDTNAFLWWNSDDPRITRPARAVIADGANELFVSAASAWEIAIKYAKGRLPLPEAPRRYVIERMELHGFRPLPIELTHAISVASLPPIHRDPFDRLLIAQAQLEHLPILTADPNIARYDVEIIW